MTPAPPIRLMIVDDHPVVRAGIASLLADCDDITVVAATGSAKAAFELCGRRSVQVVLMDLAMPEIDGATATARLRELDPDVRVVILTGFVDSKEMRAAVRAGANACLLKTVGEHELAEAIRGVMQGRSTFSSEFLPYLIASDEDEVGPAETLLTARELDILTLVADGQTNKGIARTLGLSAGTVRIYVSTILGKLGAANRTEATVVAIQRGLVEQPSCSS